MGVDTENAVGIYFEVDLNKEIETKIVVKGCINSSCVNNHKKTSSKFCPSCGDTTQEFDKIKKSKLNYWNIVEELGIDIDTLMCPEMSYNEGDYTFMHPNVCV